MFGGAVAVTALGAVVLGGALSWTNSDYDLGQAKVGELDWELFYADIECSEYNWEFEVGEGEDPNASPDWALFVGSGEDCDDPLLGPNGNEDKVGAGLLWNAGDFGLEVDTTASQLEITGTDNTDCDFDDFNGRLALSAASDNDIEPNSLGGGFYGFIEVDDNAPADCQGALVSYIVGITVNTTNTTNAQ
jgi:hypothetical protein